TPFTSDWREAMGASGKKLQGHGTRKKLNSPPAQTKDGGHGLPPHPLALRSGQRFTPRTGARRRPFQVLRVDRLRGRVQARRIDGQREPVSASAAGLLRTRSDGQGRYVQFVGFDARRYETFATVVAIDGEGAATLVLPEWHPRRPVPLPARLLPPEARVPGAWLRCTADLSMGRAGWLNVADLRRCEDPGPERCHRPELELAAAAAPMARPDSGRGCGDIVLALPESGLERFPRCDGLLELYLADRPAGLGPCDRVYLERDGRIAAHLVVRTR